MDLSCQLKAPPSPVQTDLWSQLLTDFTPTVQHLGHQSGFQELENSSQKLLSTSAFHLDALRINCLAMCHQLHSVHFYGGLLCSIARKKKSLGTLCLGGYDKHIYIVF